MAKYVLGLLVAAGAVWGQSDGANLYRTRCAQCHDGRPFFPTPAAMKGMPAEHVLQVLTTGMMRPMAAGLTAADRTTLAEYLTGKKLAPESAPAGTCAGKPPASLSGPQWNGWGLDPSNSRFQENPGVSASQVPNLKLAWAFGYPSEVTAYSQPTIAGGRVFVGSPAGRVYSLDAKTGCTFWMFQAETSVRSSVVIGDQVAYIGDTAATIYAVNIQTGKQLWKTKVDDFPSARITGGLKLYRGRVYVPVSSHEEFFSYDTRYECCRFRGSVVALDAANGKQVWKTYTVSKPAEKMTVIKGLQTWGPSGNGVWMSPTIDENKQVLYVGTGDAYSGNPDPMTDAVLALSLSTGKIVWLRQLTAEDVFNGNCLAEKPTTCPEKPGPDFDLGASPILRTGPNGKRMLLVGQKSGILYALDPDSDGKVLWQVSLSKGGVLGGIEWGMAADKENVYVPISDEQLVPSDIGLSPDPKVGGGLHAVSIATGKLLWSAKPPSAKCDAPGCSPAQPGAASVIPGVVFAGALDGHLRAYSTKDGSVIWDYDTVRSYDTVNKVPAHGGSLDGQGPVIVNGMLFVNSGYSVLNQQAGNVLLAFKVE